MKPDMLLKNSHVALVLPAVLSAVLLARAAPTASETSTSSGVYTEEQAQRGKKVHAAVCAQCHGLKLDGAGEPDMIQAPPIAGRALLKKWYGASVASLFAYTKTTMPPTNPASLTDQEYADAISYMLKLTNMPAGTRELPATTAQLSAIMMKTDEKP
jgi:S-disulfanyl-L-cysteine oxidoreductase SoxD